MPTTQVGNSVKNAAVPMPNRSAVRSKVRFTRSHENEEEVAMQLSRARCGPGLGGGGARNGGPSDFSVFCQRVNAKMCLINPN